MFLTALLLSAIADFAVLQELPSPHFFGSIRFLCLDEFVSATTFSPKLDLFAGASSRTSDTTLRGVNKNKHLADLNNRRQGFVTCLRFSGDGKMLAAGGLDNETVLWDIATKKPLRTLAGHSHTVTALAFNQDSSWLLSGSRDGTIRVWDVPTGKELAILKELDAAFSAVAFSPDGSLIVGLGGHEKLCVWNRKALKHVKTLDVSYGLGPVLGFTPDGNTLLCASDSKPLLRWDTKTWAAASVELEKGKDVESTALSADGKLVAGCIGRSVAVWDTTTGKRFPAEARHETENVIAVGFDSEGKSLATVTRNFECKIGPVVPLKAERK